MHRSRGPERAQTTPLVAVVLVFAALLLLPLALVIGAAVDRADAQSAADATALAGAAAAPGAGEPAAVAIADANDAELTEYHDDGTHVEVTVLVGDRRATARAERVVRRRSS